MAVFRSFEECWSAIQRLPVPKTIAAWSVAGRATTQFEVCAVWPNAVDVRPEHGEQRRVGRADFERVFAVWDDYVTKRRDRYTLGFSQNSTYVISILHTIGA